MPIAEWYYVKNWYRFQHYQKRNPPWIKLHRTILTDPDILELTEIERCRLFELWMIASEFEGRLKLNQTWIKRRLNLNSNHSKLELMLAKFLAKGFISLEDTRGQQRIAASEMLASKTEAETETDIYVANPADPPKPRAPINPALGGAGHRHRPRFVPPSREEATAYHREKQFLFDFAKWWETYTEPEHGWYLSNGIPMRSWRGSMRTWNDNEVERRSRNGRTPPHHAGEKTAAEIAADNRRCVEIGQATLNRLLTEDQ